MPELGFHLIEQFQQKEWVLKHFCHRVQAAWGGQGAESHVDGTSVSAAPWATRS